MRHMSIIMYFASYCFSVQNIEAQHLNFLKNQKIFLILLIQSEVLGAGTILSERINL